MNETRSRGRTLESWAASLSFLADDVARGIQPMARRIELAMSERTSREAGLVEPNGYEGLTRRGDLGRLLLSDWALAEFEPDEFLRKLVTAELSYLELSFHEPRPPSQIAVLLDAGPEQLGAPRLAQLAGLIVLDRRARSLGVPIVIGVLGDDPTEWRPGELPELFAMWLRARRARRSEQADVDAWFATLQDESSMWLFGAPLLSVDHLDGDCWQLSAVESDWGPEGATRLEATVAERKVELKLPDRSMALRLFRGQGLRRRDALSIGVVEGGLRYPSFHGSVRRLLGRGDSDGELIVLPIPQSAERSAGRPRPRHFPGPVLAASLIGTRTVALVATGGGLRVVVVGKHLGSVNQIDIPMSELGLDPGQIEHICATGLEPLFFFSGRIVVRLDGQWWSIDPLTGAERSPYADVRASRISDRPRFVRRRDADLMVDERVVPGIEPASGVHLGPGRSAAFEVGDGVWQINVPQTAEIRVDSDATVIGLTSLDTGPALLVQSPGGHILRLAQQRGTKTLTKFSHDVATVALHPTLAIVAIQRTDGSVDVVDLEGLEILSRIRAQQS